MGWVVNLQAPEYKQPCTALQLLSVSPLSDSVCTIPMNEEDKRLKTCSADCTTSVRYFSASIFLWAVNQLISRSLKRDRRPATGEAFPDAAAAVMDCPCV